MKEILIFTKKDHLKEVRCVTNGHRIKKALVVYENGSFFLPQNKTYGGSADLSCNQPEVHGYKASWFCQRQRDPYGQSTPLSNEVRKIYLLSPKNSKLHSFPPLNHYYENNTNK